MLCSNISHLKYFLSGRKGLGFKRDAVVTEHGARDKSLRHADAVQLSSAVSQQCVAVFCSCNAWRMMAFVPN